MAKNYALITGASRGLGKAFAQELAQNNHHLILVSLPNEGLENVARELHKNGNEVLFFETDFCKKKNIAEFSKQINAQYNIDILINNAGFGGGMHFLEADGEYLDKIIQLNVRATSLLTHQLLPNLLRQKKAYVLNVSSLAAKSPIAYKTVYPASKAFVHNFTRSLQNEFSESPVSFSVLNPGPMKTNQDVSERFKKHGRMINLIFIPTEEVARVSIKQMFRKKKVIKLNWAHRFGWFLLHVVPESIRAAILSRSARKEVSKKIGG
ncbi:MAG: SDR family NAD(P)-dependent oxidoreductase [Salegentibacter sp.]